MNFDKEYNKQIKDEMLKVLIKNGKINSFKFALKDYKGILSKYWDMDDLNNLYCAKSAIDEFKYLFAEEIEDEEESQRKTKYGLGFFGTLLAIIVGISEAFGGKK